MRKTADVYPKLVKAFLPILPMMPRALKHFDGCSLSCYTWGQVVHDLWNLFEMWTHRSTLCHSVSDGHSQEHSAVFLDVGALLLNWVSNWIGVLKSYLQLQANYVSCVFSCYFPHPCPYSAKRSIFLLKRQLWCVELNHKILCHY